MNKEVWRDIPNYERLYQASTWGRIKSLNYKRTGEERILKPDKIWNGYLRLRLFKDGKGKKYLVHQLIAMTFIPNPDKLPQVHHKNEDKTCNVVNLDDLYGESTNLEWCTNKCNSRYSRARGVIQYDLQGTPIKEWNCISEASEETKIERRNIIACCRERRHTAGKYKWKYKDAS